MEQFADFEIWIRPKQMSGAADKTVTHEVQVFSSPAGTAVGELALNLQDPAFKANLAQVSGTAPNLELRRKFGRDLFDALFSGDVHKAWINSWGRVAAGFARGLLLRLSIEDPALAFLPWELLHDPDKGFLAVSADTAVTRYLRVPEPPLLVQQKPLRILVIIESPQGNGLAPISEQEQLSLKKALDDLGQDVSYRVLNNVGPAEIQNALQQDPHVIHFLGHGTSGKLALVNKDFQVEIIDDQQFATLFLGRRTLRLVVLSSCYSSKAQDDGLFTGMGPALVKAGIPAVVAMQYPTVQMDTAGTFSRAMYRALANGLSVDVAVNEGRNLLAAGPLLSSRDWSTPILYLGTRSGRILDFPGQNKELVEDAWKNVQAAARESGAMGAITQLSQRFEALAEQHRMLRALMEALNHINNLRVSYSFLDEQVRQSGNAPQNFPFPVIKQSWIFINQTAWQTLSAFVQAQGKMNTAEWYTKLDDKRGAVNSAIENIALVDLRNQLNAFKELSAQTEAQIRQQLEDAVTNLVSFSDQTLPLLSSM